MTNPPILGLATAILASPVVAAAILGMALILSASIVAHGSLSLDPVDLEVKMDSLRLTSDAKITAAVTLANEKSSMSILDKPLLIEMK